jgi:aconitase B
MGQTARLYACPLEYCSPISSLQVSLSRQKRREEEEGDNIGQVKKKEDMVLVLVRKIVSTANSKLSSIPSVCWYKQNSSGLREPNSNKQFFLILFVD